MRTELLFDSAAERWLPELIALLALLQQEIADDYRASNEPDDDIPAMAITIATDETCSDLAYQTGDNSFSGACYSYPFWGIATLTRDCGPAEVAKELLRDLADNWYQGIE